MPRWLPKEEREKRDKKVIELYQQGFSYEVICKRMGFSGKSGAVAAILARHCIAVNRVPSKEEREERDRKVIELYRQGATHLEIRLACGGASISQVLKRHGLKTDRRRQ